MKVVDIRTVKAQLSRLVGEAAKGKSFIISQAGKPMVKVLALNFPATKHARRLGFLRGQFLIPDDFDDMAREPINRLFHAKR